MKEPELTQWRNQYRENGYYYRGKLIESFNMIESTLTAYLISYFLGNPNTPQANDFRNIILDRLTFEAKRTALRAILDKKENDKGFIKTKNKSYPHGKLLDEIRLLNDQRNYFAHYQLIIPFHPNDTIVTLAEFRDSLKFVEYDIERYNSILLRMSRMTIKLNEMFRLLNKTT